MAEFRKEQVEVFLGVVRKYMQVRGALSQKDLAELTEVGVSTMSRFLSLKTTELNAQLIAKIVAKLNIPLHEMIDFVDEGFSDRFIRLVKFYKDESPGAQPPEGIEKSMIEEAAEEVASEVTKTAASPKTQTQTAAKVSVAGGPTRTLPFGSEGEKSETIKDKIAALTPRQKAYLTDFLNLDAEGKDLMVDLGNSLFRYFRQKGLEI